MLTNTLSQYFTSLSPKDYIKVSLNIIKKFQQSKNRINAKIAGNLYKIYHKYENRKIKRKVQQWNLRAITQFTSYCSKTSKKSSSYGKKGLSSSCSSLRNFFARQEQYSTRKSTSKEKILLDQEEKTSNQCTFTPNMSLSHSVSLSSLRPKNETHRSYRTIDSIQTTVKTQRKKIDKQKIEKLYNDYKNKQLYKKKLQKKFDREDGMTFSPNFISSPRYLSKVDGDVVERSSRTIENKKDFVKTFKYLREMEFKRGQELLRNRNKEVKKDLYEYCLNLQKHK